MSSAAGAGAASGEQLGEACRFAAMQAHVGGAGGHQRGDAAEAVRGHGPERGAGGGDPRVLVERGQRDQRGGRNPQQPARLAGEGVGECVLAGLRREGEHPRDEREAVGG